MDNLTSLTPQQPTRRHFIQNGLVGSAALLGLPTWLRGDTGTRLRVAAVGVGGFGFSTFTQIASHPRVDITALCDVSQAALDRAAKDYSTARQFKDWRVMLEKAASSFDAVVVATPDHMHASIALESMRAGKHVYVQKPLAATLHECRVLREEAAQSGVVTQLGNQKRSSVESRTAVELLQRGSLGKIKEVIVWENKALNWWPKNETLRQAGDPVPGGFDWDLWLGVRDERPFLADTYHPMSWRAWTDFGVGELGDMGCHHLDECVDGLKLSAPLRVRQTTPGGGEGLWGKQREVEFEFAATEYTAGDSLKLTWYDGDKRPPLSRIPLPQGVDQLPESGTLWVGENGAMFKNFRKGLPVMIGGDMPAPLELEPRSHYHDWVDAILNGTKACSDFSHGGILSETVLIGALADRFPERWLEWDAATTSFKNLPEAAPWIRRNYRDGWNIEGLG